MSFHAAAQRAPAISDLTTATLSGPEAGQDSILRPAAALALLGGQSSVPESNPALSLAGGLLAIGMVLLRRGRLSR